VSAATCGVWKGSQHSIQLEHVFPVTTERPKQLGCLWALSYVP
jgi:hypothetical protein